MLLFKGHLSQHTYDFSATFYYEKLASSTATTVVLFVGRLWLCPSGLSPPLQLAECNPRLNSRIVHLKIRKAGNDHPWQWDSCHIYKWTETRANTQCHCDWWAVQKCKCNCWAVQKIYKYNYKCIVKLMKACIFIDFHLDVELQQDVYQIGVGIIEHINVTQYTQKLLLKFCPLKVCYQQRVF